MKYLLRIKLILELHFLVITDISQFDLTWYDIFTSICISYIDYDLNHNLNHTFPSATDQQVV